MPNLLQNKAESINFSQLMLILQALNLCGKQDRLVFNNGQSGILTGKQ